MTDRPYTVTYSYELVPTIKKFALSNKRHRFLAGPFGSGKSGGCIWEIIRRGNQQAPSRSNGIRQTRWAVVRNTFRQLTDTTLKSVLDWLPPAKFGQYKVADHDYIITGFPGCEIILNFRALDRPDHISNLLSLELTGAWFNEFREIPKVIFDAMDGRLDRYPATREGGATWTGMIADTNPYDDESEWKSYCEEGPEGKEDREAWEKNVDFFRQPSGLSKQAENIVPTWEEYNRLLEMYQSGQIDYLPGLKPDYYTNLVVGKSQEYIKVYVKGENGFVKEGRSVYENSWNDTAHTAQSPLSPIQGRTLIVGVDFGLTPAAIIGQLTPKGFMNVLREITTDSMGFKQFLINRLKPMLNTDFHGYEVLLVGDPAGLGRSQTDEKTCFDIAYDLGFKIVAAQANDLTARVGAVENFLSRMTEGEPTFRLDPSCKILRQGFNKGYYYRKKQTNEEQYTPEPVKNKFSHPHDALQYLCMYFNADIAKATKKRIVIPRIQRRATTYAGY